MHSYISFNNIDGFRLSSASSADISELVLLINHAFEYQDTAKGAPRIDEAGLIKKIGKSDFYVWKDGSGRIAACCYLDVLEDTLHFGLLAVDDRYRGKGIAPLIINSIERYGTYLGKQKLELEYMDLSPWLKRYYENYGFSETGFVEDIGWSKLIRMTKPL